MTRKPTIGQLVQQTTQRILTGGIQNVLEAHREEILQLLKTAQEERGAALLHDICRRFPAAGFGIHLAMSGDAVVAIQTIENFDPGFAGQLRDNLDSFRKLQDAYRRGAEQ